MNTIKASKEKLLGAEFTVNNMNEMNDIAELINSYAQKVEPILVENLKSTYYDEILSAQKSCRTVEDWRKYFGVNSSDAWARTDLQRVMAYALLAGGKRLRPVLAIFTYELLQDQSLSGVRQLPAELKPIITAIESIHTYSLIHDDLPCMDDDVLRHGRPTIHTIFNEADAILVGDALQTYAWQTLAQLSRYVDSDCFGKIISTFATSAAAMVEGQWVDVAIASKNIGIDDLINMVRNKTAALLKTPVLATCHLLNCPDDVRMHLSSFVENLGIAFQIKDDILDFEAEQDSLGKSVGKDFANHKTTFVTMLNPATAKEYLWDFTERAEQDLRQIAELGYDVKVFAKLIQWLARRKV